MEDIWAEYIKKVKPLRTTKPYISKKNTSNPVPKQEITETNIIKSAKIKVELSDLHLGDRSGVDNNLRHKMDTGKLKIDGTLDLHGYNRNDAFFLFKAFVIRAAESGKRTLLVITGKGTKSMGQNSILKAELPHWINEPQIREHILRFSTAHSKHGGEGAFYILLKRKRI